MKNSSKRSGRAKQYFALATNTRLEVAKILSRKKDASVEDLTREIGVSQPLMSQQLSVMIDAGVLEREREGRRVYYWLTKLGKELLNVTK